MLEVAQAVRPRLVENGMFLVGLDIVGNKLMEINVFTPGGLASAEKFENQDFPGLLFRRWNIRLTRVLIPIPIMKISSWRHSREVFTEI